MEANQEATPLVWNNTIFGVTNWSIVFAVDARVRSGMGPPITFAVDGKQLAPPTLER